MAFKVLLNYFADFSDFEFIGTFNNSLQALDFINNNCIDTVFLDINMPMITGFELISLIKNNTKVVITNAFREFATESYDLEVLNYLVNPIPLPRFIKCSNKITNDFSLKNNLKIESVRLNSHIFIKVEKEMVKINIDEILFIEEMKKYIKVVTVYKTYITHKSLTSLTEELPLDRFIKIHKSYTIAIDKVKFIEGNRI